MGFLYNFKKSLVVQLYVLWNPQLYEKVPWSWKNIFYIMGYVNKYLDSVPYTLVHVFYWREKYYLLFWVFAMRDSLFCSFLTVVGDN